MKGEIDIDGGKSYATRENLIKAIQKHFSSYIQDGLRYIICRNDEGRWTAVFLVSEFMNSQGGGYMGFAATKGFMSV